MTISCINADVMNEYFIIKHKPSLDEKLQSKFGDYAEVTINTVENEDGGDIKLSFGIYDLRDELVNFSNEVAMRINNDKDYEYTNLTSEKVKESITQYVDNNNLNIDIDWEEDSKSITLFFNDKDYKSMETDKVLYSYRFMILDELYNSINIFIDSVIKDSIKEFNEAWVYDYSCYEE